jgi:thiol-disulfide isomerase/thioredoxin
MNNKSLIKSALVILVLGAFIGYGIYENRNKTTDKKTATTSQTPAANKVVIPDEKSYMSADISKQGNYVSLADYKAKTEKFVGTKVVYFFHASWCPTCQSIDKEIVSELTKIPAGVTLVKTDFDANLELRKKFGVTQQYTFVQVDAEGNKTALWSAPSLSDAIAGIK